MIFDLNEGTDMFEFGAQSSASENFFDTIEEEVCNLENPVLASTWVGVRADGLYGRLMEATAVAELMAVEESGTMAIYEVSMAGAKDRVKQWFDKAKEVIKKIGAYIKGFFIKMFKMLETTFATNAKIVRDNDETLKKAWTSKAANEMKITGWVFNYNEIKNTSDRYNFDTKYNTKAQLITLKDKTVENVLNEIRGTTSDAAFRRKMADLFRNNAKAKTTDKLKTFYESASVLIGVLDQKNTYMKAVKDDHKAAQEEIQRCIKNLHDLEKEITKSYDELIDKATEDNVKDAHRKSNEDYMSCASKALGVFKGVLRIQNVQHSEHVKAIREASMQARAVANALIRKGTTIKDLGGVKESTLFDDEYEISFNEEY